jgi:hypothetical protein
MSKERGVVVDYRKAFVDRALDLIQSFRGSVPGEVKEIVAQLGEGKTAGTLTSHEFNVLVELGNRIDTQRRLVDVQKKMRKAVKVVG